MPGAGSLVYLSAPQESPNVRIETGVRQGDEVSPYYDPMIAKLVVSSSDRVKALKELERNLNKYAIVGPSSNISFLQRLAANQHFIDGDVHTGFIEQHFDELFPAKEDTVAVDSASRAVFAYLVMEDLALDKATPNNPFVILKDFKVNLPASREITFKIDDCDVTVTVTRIAQSDTGEKKFRISVASLEEVEVYGLLETDAVSQSDCVVTTVNGVTQRHKVVMIAGESGELEMVPDQLYLFPTANEKRIKLAVCVPSFYSKMDSTGASGTQPIAPMTGKVEKVLVSAGDTVTEGQPLVVMIAMKMEHTIRSPRDGVVESVLFNEGDQADKGAFLVKLEANEGE